MWSFAIGPAANGKIDFLLLARKGVSIGKMGLKHVRDAGTEA